MKKKTKNVPVSWIAFSKSAADLVLPVGLSLPENFENVNTICKKK